jgi:hypothetical protein
MDRIAGIGRDLVPRQTWRSGHRMSALVPFFWGTLDAAARRRIASSDRPSSPKWSTVLASRFDSAFLVFFVGVL